MRSVPSSKTQGSASSKIMLKREQDHRKSPERESSMRSVPSSKIQGPASQKIMLKREQVCAYCAIRQRPTVQLHALKWKRNC
ncbi:hypothetical protein QN277_011963 [Acacia crassicarpa]|uniref:Uncharacterized protein n=1 Tax=Acacia crassicarpa TaxID=499986 RepID=A0AAE1MZY4_9FABA|nr:hypothetical protein QN277_011963 [Acacia crassicarpa]